MYTVEDLLEMYDNDKHEIYKEKVEDYLKAYSELFKDEPQSINRIESDAENMNSILDNLHEGNKDVALELMCDLDTLVREHIGGFLIENKKG